MTINFPLVLDHLTFLVKSAVTWVMLKPTVPARSSPSRPWLWFYCSRNTIWKPFNFFAVAAPTFRIPQGQCSLSLSSSPSSLLPVSPSLPLLLSLFPFPGFPLSPSSLFRVSPSHTDGQDGFLAGIRSLVYVVQLLISRCIATCSMTGFTECFDFLI